MKKARLSGKQGDAGKALVPYGERHLQPKARRKSEMTKSQKAVAEIGFIAGVVKEGCGRDIGVFEFIRAFRENASALLKKEVEKDAADGVCCAVTFKFVGDEIEALGAKLREALDEKAYINEDGSPNLAAIKMLGYSYFGKWEYTELTQRLYDEVEKGGEWSDVFREAADMLSEKDPLIPDKLWDRYTHIEDGGYVALKWHLRELIRRGNIDELIDAMCEFYNDSYPMVDLKKALAELSVSKDSQIKDAECVVRALDYIYLTSPVKV